MICSFATCRKLPLGTPDDMLLVPLLATQGWIVKPAIWNDPAVDWSQFDCVVVRSTWDYFLDYPAFQNWLTGLEKKKVRVFNSLPTLRWNLDKSYLKKLQTSGVPTIPTHFIDEETHLADLCATTGWDQLVLKPTVSADGHGTIRFAASDASQHQNFLDQRLKKSSMMLQPYLPGVTQNGERSYLYFNKKFSHCVLKKPKAGEFLVQTTHGGSAQEVAPQMQDFKIAEHVLSLVPEDLLYARVDLIENAGKTYLGELELVEPSLYFALNRSSLDKFVSALIHFSQRVRRGEG